jgi:hypothetical protein
MPAGTISADGRVSIDLPTPPSGGQSLGDTFPSCHEDGAAIADPVFTEFFPTSLFVAHGEEEELGSLRLAASRDVAAWQDSYGESPAAKGAWFQWIRVTQDATVEADCRTTMHTGEGDESSEIVTEYRVAFAPEWNLMRNDIQTLHTSPSGKTQPARTQVTALQALPEDATWHFFGN